MNTHDAGMVGSGITITSGLFLWFGENATAIGAIVTVATFLLTALFLTLNLIIKYRLLKIEEKKNDSTKTQS